MIKLSKCILTHSLIFAASAAPLSAEVNIFGDTDNDTGLAGYLYDLKFDNENEPSKLVDSKGKFDAKKFYKLFEDLIKKEFDDKTMAEYKIADECCYFRYLSVKLTQAKLAPTAFGSSYIDPTGIVIIYEGIIEEAPQKEFRFAGTFDDAMVIFVNDKVVFYSAYQDFNRYEPDEESNQRKDGSPRGLAYGDYITLNKDDTVKIVLAEVPGGSIGGTLQVQLKSFRYDLNSFKDPILHPFSTIAIKRDEEKELKSSGYQYEYNRMPEFVFKKD